MKLHRIAIYLASGLLLVLLAAVAQSESTPAAGGATERARLQRVYNDGNFKDAYDSFRKLVLDKNDDPALVGADLNNALSALRQLGRLNELDELRESAVATHPKNWRLLMEAADSYVKFDHFGFIIAGKFARRAHRGGGQPANSWERDRVRALQLMVQAMPQLEAAGQPREAARFWWKMAEMLFSLRGEDQWWRLERLTNLDVLPDYELGYRRSTSSIGAPVDEQGNPIFYTAPKSWNAAQNDGQRWRWALAQAVENDVSRRNEVGLFFADCLRNQFDVQTLAYFGTFFDPRNDDSTNETEGPWSLPSLKEDETIARLATGVKRFALSDEFNFIHIYQQIADDRARTAGPKHYSEEALNRLAELFENRRQYSRAAEYWRRSIAEFGPGAQNFKQDRLNQIVGNWGRFESVVSQPAGAGATIDFRFRNGNKVGFTAQEIDIGKLLADVKSYLKANPRQLDQARLNIGDLGYRLVQQKQSEYVGRQVAAWELSLEPRAEHFDKRITVHTPLEKAGAYLLTAKMADGNSSQIIVWLEDTAIVKKPLSGGTYYYVADAASGAPLAKANVNFFGYRFRSVGTNRFTIDTQDYTHPTDADGQLVEQGQNKNEEYQWIITATTPEGRLAYLGFTGVWSGAYANAEYNQPKVFTITDRPVYRPGQKLQFKFWVGRGKYDQDDKSEFANQTFNIQIDNPKGEKVFAKAFTADAYGGIEGDFELPADATLGMYQLYVVNYGGGSFRVEEYKKPEFEVTVNAPEEVVMLGDKIKATVRAKYYFGSPVVNAKVNYKVLRSSYNAQWYPAAKWDWLYGPGYWWFAENYPWYPGWRDWGCPRPGPGWWGFNPQPAPEVVAEREVPIGPDGKAEIEIDTSIAKLVHPDQDHQYSIVAEVVDASRRTIVGQGKVLVARRPFQVYTWVDRGYYRVGDTIRGEFQTQTLDQKPVHGKGIAHLFRITYDNGKPVENAVGTWEIDPDASGHSELQLQASAAGQFRLAYQVTDNQGHKIEGAQLFTIVGEKNADGNFQFNDLELITDRREYQPGQSVNLLVNANHSGGTVLLFVRPANGVYLQPKLLRLSGKSAVEEIAVTKQDMPNFFVEAVTVVDGKVITQSKQIVVPPEQRVLEVNVAASSETYKPGQKALVDLKLTDSAGKPFVGSTVVAIYDKAVEYISGGSNVDDIKACFWKWQRSHYPQTETNLARVCWNLVPLKQPSMSDLGMFGGSIADESNAKAPAGVASSAGGRAPPYVSRAMSFGAIPAPEATAAVDLNVVDSGATNPLVQPTVRTNFADTALWAGAITTDENGTAQVSLTMPDSLTTWRVRVWSLGHGTRVGESSAEIVTRKDLLVRLQAPRFFVEKDEVVLSAIVHNYLKSAKLVTVGLELDGKCLAALTDTSRQVEVPSGGETRIDWPVKVVGEGEAVVRMKALSDEESDAVEQRFPAYIHGMLKTESFCGALRPDETVGKITLKVPDARRVEQSRLELRFTPTLAGAMVDALPYLVNYPHGCTEQTLNRFLPTVMTQRILIKMGLDLKKIQEKQTNLNSQQIGNDQDRSQQWQQRDRSNPVFDQAEVSRMVKDGVQALAEMQLADGGWGWFSGWGEQSFPHTTAVVVHGLEIAKENDVALPPGILERGVAWLKNYQDRQVQSLKNAALPPPSGELAKRAADNLDALVFMVLVDAGVADDSMRDFLYRDRNQLSVYSQAMFGLSLHKLHSQDQLAMVLDNLRQFVVEDEENQTAYLKLPANFAWWNWYGSETEANAYYLKLLSKTDPHGKTASRLVKYLAQQPAECHLLE